MTIYLAGAMTGKTYEEMNGWREEVTRAIERSTSFNRMVRVINPVLYYSTADEYDDDKEYIRWELRNAENADVVISGCDTKVNSIGTSVETALAFKKNVPIVLFITDGYACDVHPYLSYMSDKFFYHDEVDKMVEYIARYFS
jgi:hypothetical protein